MTETPNGPEDPGTAQLPRRAPRQQTGGPAPLAAYGPPSGATAAQAGPQQTEAGQVPAGQGGQHHAPQQYGGQSYAGQQHGTPSYAGQPYGGQQYGGGETYVGPPAAAAGPATAAQPIVGPATPPVTPAGGQTTGAHSAGATPVPAPPRPPVPTGHRDPLTRMGPWAPLAGGAVGAVLGVVAVVLLARSADTFAPRLALVFVVLGLVLLGAAAVLLAEEVRLMRRRAGDGGVARPSSVEATAGLLNGLTPARLLLTVSAFVLFLAAYVVR